MVLARLTRFWRLFLDNSIRSIAAISAGATLALAAFGMDAATNSWRRVQFREPQATAYLVEPLTANRNLASRLPDWVRARPDNGTTNEIAFGSRIVLQVQSGVAVGPLLSGRPLTFARQVATNLFILQASNSVAAIDQAEWLAQQPEVKASYPVMRRAFRLQGRYAPAPNDPYFGQQWHLENRDTNGAPKGVDLNLREAWSVTRGAGVLVADGDDGIELTHPELATRGAGQPHYNFDTDTTNGSPETLEAHGTAVAGLIAAEGNNNRGVIGVAPQASLASWVIFAGPSIEQEQIVGDEALMNMFAYATNQVAVQNHSWANPDGGLSPLNLLSDSGIGKAISDGRGGLGEVIVRAGGNERVRHLGDVNFDGYANDPRVIAVAAVRADGRVCSYSNPGACLLVAAPSGDPNADGTEDPAAPNLVTTDRQGSLGFNTNGPGDSADYCFGESGFDGTSGSTPQIAGLAALVLAANPRLGYRDVQQILLQSARHYDFADPDVRTNGAGFIFSHNVGFGVPDAGFAVALAKHWINRPATQRLALASNLTVAIPTNGLRLVCAGPGLTNRLTSIASWPCQGPHPDAPTAALPLVYVGQANSELSEDLHGKAALIQRGVSLFSDKISRAARAGAAFAIVFNNTNGTDYLIMAGTAFTPIPAVFLNQNDGEALRDYVQSQSNQTAQIVLTPATATFNVTNTAICEHVGIELKTTAPARSALRVTLISPMGTRSVLQAVNNDSSPGPTDWTYWSVQHCYESSFGTWRLEVSNEQSSSAASVTYAQLLIDGIPITDTDHDGLDDNWELKSFGALAYGPQDNPAGDGYSNARKQCLDLSPTKFDPLVRPDLSLWNDRLARVSFPAVAGQSYQVWASAQAELSLTLLTNVTGRLPEFEIFVPYRDAPYRLFRAVATPAQAQTHQ